MNILEKSLIVRVPFVIAIACGLAFSTEVLAQTVTECDRLASNPADEGSVTEGVNFDNVMAGKAIEACERALEQHPDDEETGRLSSGA